jgi:alpha-tubulin suppressor-like RCC1 family protein
VGAGGNHTCGRTTGGVTYCWGGNASGQLGDGSTTNRPAPVAVSGGLALTGGSEGANHTCAHLTSGAAYCWGGNTTGQLGNGSTTPSSVPTKVAGQP